MVSSFVQIILDVLYFFILEVLYFFIDLFKKKNEWRYIALSFLILFFLVLIYITAAMAFYLGVNVIIVLFLMFISLIFLYYLRNIGNEDKKTKENPITVQFISDSLSGKKSEINIEIVNEVFNQIEITSDVNGYFIAQNGTEEIVKFKMTGKRVEGNILILFKNYSEEVKITSTKELGNINRLNFLEFQGKNGAIFKVSAKVQAPKTT